jgi:hypothetical protein
MDMGRDDSPQIECFRIQTPKEIRERPGFRRWMDFAAMFDGTLLIPTQGVDENLMLAAKQKGVPVHHAMGIGFISVEWVLAQAIPPKVRQAYENMKAHMLEAYRTRPPVPETPEAITGRVDDEKDQDALLDWIYAVPGRVSLIREDRSLGGMEFRTSGKDARFAPAAYESLTAYLVSVGIDPKNREWKASDWN